MARTTTQVVVGVQDVSEDSRTMLAALRAAVQSPADADRPGRLRRRLEEVLGPEESARLRRLVHQVVAASEENLPQDLRRITPLTPQSLQRLSDDLAQARGWSPEVARRTTHLWASALGFADLAAASWPRDSRPRSGAVPVRGEATLLPPGSDRPSTPSGPHAAEPPRWPTPPRSLASHTATRSGEPALGVALAYAGMSLPLCVAAVITLTVLLCLPFVLVGASGVLLPLLGVLGARLLVGRLGRGALVASDGGVEFVPYDVGLRKPLLDRAFAAPWSGVEVERGTVSVVRFDGRRVQVGPRNRGFADAVAGRAGEAR